MINKNILLTIFLIFPNLYSQEVIILDRQTSNPLKDVNIFNKNDGITSDKNGQCNLDNFEESDTLVFSLIGYSNIQLVKSMVLDTVKMQSEAIPLDLVSVYGSRKFSRKRYFKLERDVRRVYPYVKVFSKNMVYYDNILNELDNYSGLKRYYKKRKIFSDIENQLLLKYDYSIRKLSKNQGRILIRLIDRETGRTSYRIIKDFRNIFSAGFWQITARIFGHNLKSNYNPQKGEDRLIEFIIGRIESNS
ncbi:MAG: hypothetical protein CMG55_09685 [Candidatus Marinimicrobia bacterium]|nr:hypothetical protein [Candidatus Neomarinimicrobiota bacterium]